MLDAVEADDERDRTQAQHREQERMQAQPREKVLAEYREAVARANFDETWRERLRSWWVGRG